VYQEVRTEMKKYALRVDDPIFGASDLTLYFERENLHVGDEIVLKRSQVKSWKKDTKAINKLFLTKGKSEKIRDRDVGNYEIKLKVGENIGYRAMESVLDPYQAFSVYVI